MDTPIIARPGGSIKGEAGTCGCADGRRCGEGGFLWATLLDARDELRAAGPRPPRRLVLAFAEARDRYHAHVRGEAA